jgi:hypothetical protein
VEPRQVAATLSTFALIGGLLQILASVVLGMARLDALTLASQEGPLFYTVAALAVAIGVVAVWVLRGRPLLAAVSFVTWQAAVLWPLSRRMSFAGLALHGEFILHHFVAVLCALACATLAWALLRDPRARRLGWPVALAAIACVAAGLVGHIAGVQGEHRLGAIALAVAASASVVAMTLWTGLELGRAPRSPARWAALALVIPIVVRVASVGPMALDHAPVPPGLRAPFVGLLIAAAVALTVLLRPRPPRVIAVTMTGLAALTTATLYLVYRSKFGDVEDGLGGLAQSILGFTPPYPEYLSNTAIVTVMIGGFLALQTAGGAMTSEDARDRGIGLALVIVAGVGWSNPQLVLMSTAGVLLFLSDLDELPPAAAPPPSPVGQILGELATRLSLAASEAAGARGVTLHALRGELRGVTVDVRAQVGRDAPRLGARLGVVARSRPEVGLQPGTSGDVPAHAIARTHRVFGATRKLEAHGDELLDACLPFPTLRLGLWPAGAEIDLGSDLAKLDAAALERLLAVLARSFAD